jgi:methyltransferase-like protein
MEGFEVAFEKKPQVETFDLENDSPAVFALNHGTFSTPNRFFKAALRVLLDAWPVPVPLVELRTRAKAMLTRCAADAAGTEGDLNRLVLDLVCAGPLEAFVHAPHFAATVSRLPSVPRLARIQAREGDHATNCRHEVITLDAFSRRFIQLLDGRHDRKALARNVQESLQAGELTLAVEGRPVSHRDRGAVLRLVDECLERLLGLSLLRS